MKPNRFFNSILFTASRSRRTIALAATVFSIGSINSVLAAVIWTNPITGTNPNTSNPYTTGQTVDANITVSGIGRGAGATGSDANNRYNASSWNTASLDTTAYFSFTLDANVGYEIDFTNFVYTGQASGTGATAFAFSSSLDGFATTFGSPTATGVTISLTGAAYQNLTGPVEFRLYGWGASSSTGTFSVNSFEFNGTVSTVVLAETAQIYWDTTRVSG
jgi:hypothetical protein